MTSGFKHQEARAYSARAHEWLRRGDGLRQVSMVMLPKLALQPGHILLDMACGPGWTALEAAQFVGPQGLVIASDIAEGMVAVAAEQARRAGATHIVTAVMDAECPALPDECADAIICRFGLIHFPHPYRALQAWHRLLKPGGRLALSVWGSIERVRPLGIIIECIEHVAPYLLHEAEPLWFTFGAPGKLATALRSSGFIPLGEHHLPMPRRFENPTAYWERQIAYSGRLALLLEHLSPEERAIVRTCALHKAMQFEQPDGSLLMPMDAIIGWARKV